MYFPPFHLLSLFLSLAWAATNPGCQLAAPSQQTLSNVRTAYTNTTANPFGFAYAAQPGYAFVTLGRVLGVLNTTTFPPTLSHNISLPAAFGAALNLQLSSDGAHLYIASSVGAIIVSTSGAIANSPGAVIGTLNGTTATQKPGTAAFQVTVTSDESHAFVTQEYGSRDERGNIDVFELAACNGSVSGSPVGYITLAYAVTGTSLSPDGNILYSTSEADHANSTLTTETGLLHTISVAELESDPFSPTALLSNASAGCGPVRTIVSSDGSVVWVTARESNHLLAFNASMLLSDPSNALLASVQVGTGPVGLAFARNETRILTADSNRYGNGNVTGVTVVDVQAALQGKGDEAALGRIPTLLFPREIVVSADGKTALVADNQSGAVQAVDVSTLP